RAFEPLSCRLSRNRNVRTERFRCVQFLWFQIDNRDPRLRQSTQLNAVVSQTTSAPDSKMHRVVEAHLCERAENRPSRTEKWRGVGKRQSFRNWNSVTLPRNDVLCESPVDGDAGDLRNIAKHLQVFTAVFTSTARVVEPRDTNGITFMEPSNARS